MGKHATVSFLLAVVLTGLLAAQYPPYYPPTDPDPDPTPPAKHATRANLPNCAEAGDPVCTFNGELYFEETDLSLGGLPPLSFTRYYGSRVKDVGISGAVTTNWMHNFDAKLERTGRGATVNLYQGRSVAFVQSGSGWTPASRAAPLGRAAQSESGWLPAAAEAYPYQLVSLSEGGFRFLDPVQNLIYTFSARGILQRIEDRNGNAHQVEASPTGAGPGRIFDGLGRSLTLTYSAGVLVRAEDQAGRSVVYTHLGGNLVAVTDANGKTTRHSYTSAGPLAGLLRASTLPAGNTPLTQEYDGEGRLARQIDSRGNVLALEYGSGSPAATTVRNALGAVFRHTYDASGNLIEFMDPSGGRRVLSYDNQGRWNSAVDRMGDRSTVTYHEPSGRVASHTDALGNTTTYSYSSQAQGGFTFYILTRIGYPDGTFRAFTHDATGNILSVTDQAAKRWTYTYNSRGQILTATNPAGGVTTVTYNQDATTASLSTPAGDITRYSYDDKKRLSRISHADGTFESFTYDNRDNLLSHTDERGKIRRFSYDDNNRLRAVTDAANNANGLTLDNDQRVIALTGAPGKTAALELDGLGRATTITAPTGEPVRLGFDVNNRLTSLTDSTGKGIGFSYDREGVPVSMTDGLGRTWSFASDKKGNITRITSPLGRTFHYTYDALGRRTSYTDPLSRRATYTRDSRGQLTAVALPGAVSASFTRNDLGKVTAITDPAGNTWRRAYDTQGRLASTTDPLGRITTYSYDSRGRVARMALPQGSVAFTYDGYGNLTRRQYSDGLALDFTFDDNNRASGATGVTLTREPSGQITGSNGLAIARDDSLRISAITYAPQKTVRYVYDRRGLLAQIGDWAGGRIELSYDDARRPATITRSNGVITRYTYDTDGRLTGITENKDGTVLCSILLRLDAAGRITSEDRAAPLMPAPTGGLIAFRHDAAAQLTDSTYDGLGRLVSRAGRTNRWDLASRLTSYDGPDGSAAFTYDAYGMLVSRTSGGVTRNYVQNYGLPLTSISIVREGSRDLRYYVHLPDGTLVYSIEAASNSRRFYHYDQTGSTLLLTADNGAVSSAYGITPYGNHVGRTGADDNPFTFLGAYGVVEEGGTGLFHMRSRWYDSTTGRFLSCDPLPGLDPAAVNLYQYASGNPLLAVDPRGRGGRAGGRYSKAEGEIGRFALMLPELLRRVRSPEESIAPRLALAILQFLHGPDAREEDRYE